MAQGYFDEVFCKKYYLIKKNRQQNCDIPLAVLELNCSAAVLFELLNIVLLDSRDLILTAVRQVTPRLVRLPVAISANEGIEIKAFFPFE